MSKIIQIIGWLGVLFILSAYFMVTFGHITAQSLIYLVFNIFGSLFILIETFSKKDYQPAFLNIVWFIIAIIAILKII